MATYQTPNIGLNKWAETDYFKRVEINENFDKIDDKIGILLNRANWISVKEFGAKGDGVSDDTNAIEATINFAANNNYAVFLPNGRYRFTRTLNFTCSVIGADRNTVVLDKDFNGLGINIQRSHCLYTNFTVDNSKKVTNGDMGDGILVGTSSGGGSRVSLENLIVKNQGGNGIRYGAWNVCFFAHIVVSNNGGDGILIDGLTSPPNANAATFVNIDTLSNTGNGIRMTQSFSNRIFGLTSQYNGKYAVEIDGNNNIIVGLYSEGNKLGSILFTSEAQYNIVVPGYINESTKFVDNDNYNARNMVFAYNYGVLQSGRFVSNNYEIDDRSISGYFKLSQNGTNRNLEITKQSTSVDVDLELVGFGNGRGIIVTGDNGTRYRIKVNSSGQVVAVPV